MWQTNKGKRQFDQKLQCSKDQCFTIRGPSAYFIVFSTNQGEIDTIVNKKMLGRIKLSFLNMNKICYNIDFKAKLLKISDHIT